MSMPASTRARASAGEDLGQVLQEVLAGGVGLAAVVLVPVADGDQERAGQRELGDAVGVRGRGSAASSAKTGSAAVIRRTTTSRVLRLPLVLETAGSARSRRRGPGTRDVLRAAPLAVADHVQARLLLQADREADRSSRAAQLSSWPSSSSTAWGRGSEPIGCV